MKYLVPLMILTRCLLIECVLEWKVLKKTIEYGQNVTLFCNVSNCCPKLAGWDKYIPAQRTIFIDIKTGRPTNKYDGNILTDGYTLVIRNLTKEDLNISYACVYGSTLGDKQTLLEENVFNYISTTQQNGPMDNKTYSAENIGTTQQSGQIDNQTFSAIKIVGVISGVSVAVSVVIFIICFWIRRKERPRNIRNRNKGLNEQVPLQGLLEPDYDLKVSSVSSQDMDMFIDAKSYGEEVRKDIRIQVIGKDRVGKTSLVRRLLFLEEEKYDEKETDLIEINGKCQIRSSDGAWIANQNDRMNQIKDAVHLQHEHWQLFSDLTSPCPKNENIDQLIETIKTNMNQIVNVSVDINNKRLSDGLIECSIMDFAGKRDFYASHQIFLSSHAIYLLVVNISEDIQSINYDEEFNSNSIGDYIDFWFDSVHCFCTNPTLEELYPPVIMVFTHTDEVVKKEGDWKMKYMEKIRETFNGQKRSNHKRGIYFISNTHVSEEDNNELKRIRKEISDIAKDRYYKTIPTMWIHLEYAIDVLRDLNINIVSWENMDKIARKNLKEDEELVPFLKYQHKVGNVVFFEEIKQYIIIKPEWLVRCFRCLVYENHDGNIMYDLKKYTVRSQLKSTGGISEEIMNQVFQMEPELKLAAHRNHLLKVMKKCDVIVKPQFINTKNEESHTSVSDSYYLPYMIDKSSSYKCIKDIFISDSSSVIITPWLVIEFEFLPLAYFNHILFRYIRNFDVCREKSDSPAIYRGKLVFFIDKLRKCIICFSHKAISLQIWEWDEVKDNLYHNMLNQLCDFIESIKRIVGPNISYCIKGKCGSGDYSSSEGRISFKSLATDDSYSCKKYQCTDCKQNIEKIWLKHANHRKKTEKKRQHKHSEVHIKSFYDECKENADTFVETRASKHVFECIQKNSCVTITASSGVGKTSTLRHVALKMHEEGYTLITVKNPNDIVKLIVTYQKTLFVIDDFCGTYFINQTDLNRWDLCIEEIQSLLQHNPIKIIVACRSQVHQDERFESLSMFMTNVCNLLANNLSLLTQEMQSIANVYLNSKASEISQYFQYYHCFPLLCKLYHDNPTFEFSKFFKKPFLLYTHEIDKLYRKGSFGKYCALALCVMFDNRLEENWLTGEIDTEKKVIMRNTLEACKMSRGTSRLILLDEFDSLVDIFFKKEQGVYKTSHAALFDFLVSYFSENMTRYVIENADSVVIMQRFLIEQVDYKDRTTYVLPFKYHTIYIQRIIDDWIKGRVQCVFYNINMKIPKFISMFLNHVKTLDIALQRRLAHICDVNYKDTVLSLCCRLGDITLIEWCLHNEVDVNQFDSYELSPLYISARKGYSLIVQLLLDNKADSNKVVDDGNSPLFVSCQKNHKDIVKLLLERGALCNVYNKKGILPSHITDTNGHNDCVSVIKEHLENIGRPKARNSGSVNKLCTVLQEEETSLCN